MQASWSLTDLNRDIGFCMRFSNNFPFWHNLSINWTSHSPCLKTSLTMNAYFSFTIGITHLKSYSSWLISFVLNFIFFKIFRTGSWPWQKCHRYELDYKVFRFNWRSVCGQICMQCTSSSLFQYWMYSIPPSYHKS